MALQSTTALATITLQEASSTVEFSGIPDTYRDLILVFSGTVTGSQGNNFLYFNGDTTGSNYAWVRMLGTGSSTSSGTAPNDASKPSVSDVTPTTINQVTIEILDYSATDKHKTRLSRSDQSSSTVIAYASRWANTAAVTSIEYSAGNGTAWSSGSTFALFGRIA